MMRVSLALLSSLALSTLVIAQNQTAKTLDIYVIDVEGGNAQLCVSPSGESVLIDTGNAGAAAVRDADRIMAAVKEAGVKQIDHLITTHFHADHVGGLPELATRIPIKEFIDHGPNVQPGPQIDPFCSGMRNCMRRRSTPSRSRRPHSDRQSRLAHRQRRGTGARTPLPGAGAPNPYCAGFTRHEVNPVSGGPVGKTEDEQSVASYVTFGKLRILYLGISPGTRNSI